eukprot:2789676-Prymnesium_polylepis.2
MREAGNMPDGCPAHLVLQAADPWSPSTHELFAVADRRRAVALLLLGCQLSTQERFFRQEGALKDLWGCTTSCRTRCGRRDLLSRYTQ